MFPLLSIECWLFSTPPGWRGRGLRKTALLLDLLTSLPGHFLSLLSFLTHYMSKSSLFTPITRPCTETVTRIKICTTAYIPVLFSFFLCHFLVTFLFLFLRSHFSSRTLQFFTLTPTTSTSQSHYQHYFVPSPSSNINTSISILLQQMRLTITNNLKVLVLVAITFSQIASITIVNATPVPVTVSLPESSNNSQSENKSGQVHCPGHRPSWWGRGYACQS